MLPFLLHRPIAVTMTALAILILGMVAATRLPVSLMPDVDIPEITVQVSGNNTSARQLENTVVSPLRRHLTQVAHLADIQSETRDEKSVINLSFNYGTDIDFAFIEVNEKIDRAMNGFPREVARPKVIKASATDVPVYYLNLTLRNESPGAQTVSSSSQTLFPVSQQFVELSSFAGQVIAKRLEQLPEVAMADISGLVYPELLVTPDMEKLEAIRITPGQLETAMKTANVNMGSLLIRDGQYQYNVAFNAALRNKRDIEELYLKIHNNGSHEDGAGAQTRLLQLKDIAVVVEHPQQRKGMLTFNGKDAVSIAVVKQSDAQIGDLKKKLTNLVDQFNKDYPEIEFAVTRDQTKLLDYSISNLTQNLVWGALLAFAVMFLFLRDFKSPLLIGVSIPASLIISLILFYLLDISINIISLSGLVLGLGMMVDNSIIVIDNITQHRERGSPLVAACLAGTSEVFGPMLSSMLTSCAVFIPLIFLSGIAGTLFYDQAVAVAIGHFASLLVGVTLIPVYYKIIYTQGNKAGHSWLSRINMLDYEALYEKGFRWVMRHQKTVWSIAAAFLLAGISLYKTLPTSRLPPITTDEILLAVDWNQKINVEENQSRIQMLVATVRDYAIENTCLVGEQQYLLDRKSDAGPSESVIYIRTKHPADVARVKTTIEEFVQDRYPDAVVNFKEADNFFNLIFPESEPPLVAHLRPADDFGDRRNAILRETVGTIQRTLPDRQLDPISVRESVVFRADAARLMSYDIPVESLYRKLMVALNSHEVFLIKDNQEFVPVVLGGKPKVISEILSETYVANPKGNRYPVRELVREERQYDLKVITAGQGGEYFPVDLKAKDTEAPAVMEKVRAALTDNRFYEVDFSGSIFSNKELIKDLAVILLISLALLYFILAAQFESLQLPFIVLVEIPIGIAGAFLFLKLFGAGINLMSLIGIVVMSGIIINDSILKLDTTNKLMKEGYSLLRALLVTGQRRLKSILMTALTTVLAMSPLLFSSGLGAELQKPLAVALVGGMVVGTLVSLYFIPLCYYCLKKGK